MKKLRNLLVSMLILLLSFSTVSAVTTYPPIVRILYATTSNPTLDIGSTQLRTVAITGDWIGSGLLYGYIFFGDTTVNVVKMTYQNMGSIYEYTCTNGDFSAFNGIVYSHIYGTHFHHVGLSVSDTTKYINKISFDYGGSFPAQQTYINSYITSCTKIDMNSTYTAADTVKSFNDGKAVGVASVNTTTYYNNGYTAGFNAAVASFPDTALFFNNGKAVGIKSVNTTTYYNSGFNAGVVSVDTVAVYNDGLTAGKATCSTTAVQKSATVNNTADVYPNPVLKGNVANVNVDNFTSVQVFDVNGRFITSSKTPFIPTNNLNSATYIIKVFTNAGSDVSVYRFVVK
jgi:hypothetical protein